MGLPVITIDYEWYYWTDFYKLGILKFMSLYSLYSANSLKRWDGGGVWGECSILICDQTCDLCAWPFLQV